MSAAAGNLLPRAAEAVSASRHLHDRSVRLCEAAALERLHSEQTRRAARAIRLARATCPSRPRVDLDDWAVEGIVEGRAVTAHWDRGAARLVSDDPEVVARTEVIVAMGETFTVPDGATTVVAALNEPLAAALTAIRAIGQVTSVDLVTPDLG